MKKKLFALAVVMICLALLTQSTIAYFTSEATATNVITTDGIKIAVEQWQQTENGLVPYPQEAPIKVMPGISVSKIVTVKNLDAPSYVRVKLELALKDAQNREMNVSEQEKERLVLLELNTEDWTQKDGWWYYNTAVDTAEATEALMKDVTFAGKEMGNEYQAATLEILITAQAVQQANNGSSPMDAKGWPE